MDGNLESLYGVALWKHWCMIDNLVVSLISNAIGWLMHEIHSTSKGPFQCQFKQNADGSCYINERSPLRLRYLSSWHFVSLLRTYQSSPRHFLKKFRVTSIAMASWMIMGWLWDFNPLRETAICFFNGWNINVEKTHTRATFSHMLTYSLMGTSKNDWSDFTCLNSLCFIQNFLSHTSHTHSHTQLQMLNNYRS